MIVNKMLLRKHFRPFQSYQSSSVAMMTKTLLLSFITYFYKRMFKCCRLKAAVN